MRTRADSPTKTCTEDGCHNPLRARGLCGTHYNRTQPNRYPQVELACEGCGATVLKDKRVQRYQSVQCGSQLCRHWIQWGAWSSDLPRFHISKFLDQTCRVQLPISRPCEWCGVSFITHKEAQRFCTRICKLKQSKATRRGIEHNAIGTYSWADITRLWLTFNRACAYCATPTPLDLIQAEHVLALSRGGANNLTNLLPSCGPCNADKRDLSLTAWATDRARRGLPRVITHWNTDDVRYSHLTSVRAAARPDLDLRTCLRGVGTHP